MPAWRGHYRHDAIEGHGSLALLLGRVHGDDQVPSRLNLEANRAMEIPRESLDGEHLRSATYW